MDITAHAHTLSPWAGLAVFAGYCVAVLAPVQWSSCGATCEALRVGGGLIARAGDILRRCPRPG